VSSGKDQRGFDGTGAVRLGRYVCGLMRVGLWLVSVGVCRLEAIGAETPCRSPMC
jgi:hypothetical protein